MNVQVLREPVYALQFRNFFPKKINELILLEAKHLKTNQGRTGKGIDKKVRTNRVIYYDDLYRGRREQSILLNALYNKFNDQRFRDLLLSSPYPLSEFNNTNFHEAQVSNYDKGQRYDWHIDGAYNKRIISLVYWFFKEPKKFKGGQLGLSNSPVYNGKMIEKNGDVLEIEPENNMAIVFSGTSAHCVMSTSCKDKEYSRYSANIWIGIQ